MMMKMMMRRMLMMMRKMMRQGFANGYNPSVPLQLLQQRWKIFLASSAALLQMIKVINSMIKMMMMVTLCLDDDGFAFQTVHL